MSIGVLVDQVKKYCNGIDKILRMQNPHNPPIYEIIILLGKYVDNDSSLKACETVKETLKNYNARVVYYDQLIFDAKMAYSEYFKQRSSINPILDIFNNIDE